MVHDDSTTQGVRESHERFGNLKGWSLPEAALLYGIVSTGFALAESAARGFDVFGYVVRSGEFDRLLLRPTALQVAGRELQLMRVGRLSQGLVVLLWGVAALEIAWTVPRIALVAALQIWRIGVRHYHSTGS